MPKQNPTLNKADVNLLKKSFFTRSDSDLKTLKGLVNLALDETIEKKGLVTKGDLKHLPTKDDLKSFATKDDLKTLATKNEVKELATKKDILRIEKKLDKHFDFLDKDITYFRKKTADYLGIPVTNLIKQN